MFRVYCIEVAKENRNKTEDILNKYCVNNDIDVKHFEQSYRNKMVTIQYWFTCTCSDDIETIANELKESGIEVF